MATTATQTKQAQVQVVETLAGLNVSVDREKGIIRGVKVIGFDSKNGRHYTPEALRGAVSKYEGAKVNIDHPPLNDPAKPRGVADRIGVLKSARFQEGAGIFADFHYNPKHSLAEQVAWAAENDPSAIGFSHNATVQQGRRQNGKQFIEAVVGVRSVDLVADPATTNGVFESEGNEDEVMDLSKLTLEQIKSARPDLVTAFESEQAGAAEVEKLQADLKTANEKIASFEKKEADAAKASEINKQLESVGFDPTNKHADRRRHVSAPFRAILEGCADEAARKIHIDDRLSVVGEWKSEPAKGATGQKPVTTSTTEATNATEGVDWLKRITSR